MILTEKEATNKTCPASLNAYSSAPGEVGAAYRDCMASKCMAWRWLPNDENTPMNDKAEWVRSGYCGLAGRPEEA